MSREYSPVSMNVARAYDRGLGRIFVLLEIFEGVMRDFTLIWLNERAG